jgi:hypothetical protein
MSRDWRIILRFAILCLTIAAVFFLFDKTDFFAKSWAGIWMFWASLALCPGLFLFGWWMAITEQPVQNVGLMWLVIGLINFVLYGAIGAAYVGLRKRPQESGTS